MPDPLKPMSEAWHQRQRVHRHNSFRGHARMIQMQCRAIVNADSTDAGTKGLAFQIEALAMRLDEDLKQRIDP